MIDQTKAEPHRALMLAVVERAILDALSQPKTVKDICIKMNAINYLCGDIYHAEICGIDSDYIKRMVFS